MTLAFRRVSVLLCVAATFVVLVQATASAGEAAPPASPMNVAADGWPDAGCGPFSLTQTYRNWGPATHYGEKVTVSYSATRCSRSRGDTVILSIEGSAVVRRGNAWGGAILDERPFYVSGRWTEASNAEGWPLDWWGCDVKSVAYTWRILGVYDFEVSAREGTWSLHVSADGRSVDWAYDACG